MTDDNDLPVQFTTDPVFVTGTTPSELEQAAITYVASLSGCSAGQLAVVTPYKLYFTARLDGVRDEALSQNQKRARASGMPLWASITVKGYEYPAYQLRENQETRS